MFFFGMEGGTYMLHINLYFMKNRGFQNLIKLAQVVISVLSQTSLKIGHDREQFYF